MRLRVLLNERLEEGGRLSWALLARDGAPTAAGDAGSPDELPRAKTLELVVPAARATLGDVRLPAGAAGRLLESLSYAVEEQLLCDPAEVETVPGPDENGLYPVAVMERDWLRRVLGAFRAAGRPAQALRSEILLAPLYPDAWTVVWRGQGGFARTGACAGFVLDKAADGAPLVLEMALRSATGHRPRELVLHAAAEAAPPDLALWQARLGLPVRLAEAWDWRAGVADPDWNLMPAQAAAGDAPSWKPVWVLAALLVAAQLGGALADYGRMAWLERQARARSAQAAARLFPGAAANRQALADRLDALRRNGGVPPGDFVALSLNLARALGDVPAGRLDDMAYGDGGLRVALVLAQPQLLQPLIDRLASLGVSAARAPDAGHAAAGAAATAVVDLTLKAKE